MRWALWGVLGLVVVVGVGGAMWSWQQRQDAASRVTFGPVSTVAHRALTTGESSALDEAAKTLTQFLKEHSRSAVIGQAWYFLGQIELRRRQWDAAASAFATAAAREGASSVGALSRLGEGAAHETKGDYARAIEAYQKGLSGRNPQGFLYGELLLAKGRAQEQAKDTASAVATYRQYLKDLPSSDRTDDVRVKLALLGSAA